MLQLVEKLVDPSVFKFKFRKREIILFKIDYVFTEMADRPKLGPKWSLKLLKLERCCTGLIYEPKCTAKPEF